MNKRYLWIGVLFCVVVAISGCTSPWNQFSEGTGSQPPSVEGVNAVSLTGPGTVIVQIGDKESLTVDASDSQKSNIDIKKTGGTSLEITNKNSDGGNVTFHLTVKSLYSIVTVGEGKINATGVDTNSLSISTTKGTVTVAGKANILTVSTTDQPSTVNAKDLEAQTATVSVTGDGNVIVNVVKSLTATVTGAGTINYLGSPSVTQTATGGGKITQGSG